MSKSQIASFLGYYITKSEAELKGTSWNIQWLEIIKSSEFNISPAQDNQYYLSSFVHTQVCNKVVISEAPACKLYYK